MSRIRPFSFLLEDEMDTLISSLEVELYGKDKILYEMGRVSPYIYLVFSGLIGLFDDDGPVDYVSRGEILGIMSVYGAPSRVRAVALEDTICYLLDMDSFKTVLERNKHFSAFFSAIVDKRFRSFQAMTSDRKILEEASFVLEINRIIYKKPVMCGVHATILDAATEMERNGVSSIIVVDGGNRPVGILTHKDLRQVIIRGEKWETVERFMSSPVKTIEAGATILSAYTTLIDAGIDHLVLTTNDGRVCGVVTRKDIQIHLEPSFSIVKLYRKVLKAATINELATICSGLRLSVAKIALTGPNFYDLTRMLCTVHDAIVTRTIRLACGCSETDRFVWVHMGSSGRKEEIIATDQDNALISRNGEWPDPAIKINESLARLGFPKCPGDYMASNRKWNQPVSVWQEYFQDWFHNPIPDHIRYLSVFLDMRPIFGDVSLYEELLDNMRHAMTKEAMRLLAYDAVEIQPPIGIFGIVGLHKGVDLKTHGIYPIVNGTRVLALEAGILDITNTRERLEVLQQRGIIDTQMCHEMLETYGFLQDLRLRHHARGILDQTDMNNVLRTKELSKLDLLLLKESLKVVASFQKFLMKRYDVSRMVLFSQL